MPLSNEFDLALDNMMPISRFKRAFRLIETTPQLRTSDNDALLKLLFIDAYPDPQDFILDIFRPLIQRVSGYRLKAINLPTVALYRVPPAVVGDDLESKMPFFTYIRGFYQCNRDSEQIINRLISLFPSPK